MTSESTKPQQRLRAIFSDIDGTIVHYQAKLEKQGYQLLKIIENSNNNDVESSSTAFDTRKHIFKHLESGKEIEAIPVPSATLGGGFISTKTIRLVSEMRNRFGVKFCVLTGARTSTFLSRAESRTLPPFDFGVCEGGGKIFTFENNQEQNGKLNLDQEWLDSFAEKSIGPWRENQPLAPEQRTGALWDLYRLLMVTPESENVLGCTPKLDAKSFDSAFMVDVRAVKDNSAASAAANAHVFGVSEVSEVEEKLKKLILESDSFKGKLTICVNLGKGHITAEGCTKADVVKYLVQQKKVAGEKLRLVSSGNGDNIDDDNTNHEEIVAGLFDDENDIEFIKLCHIGFAPGVAHPAVTEFLSSKASSVATGRYKKCEIEGFLGTEEALSELMEKYCF